MQRLARSLVIAAFAAALFPAVAQAQQRSPFDRLFVGAFGGLTATGAATDAAVAGRAGVTITRHLVVFGEGGRMQNVLPPNRAIGMERVVAAGYLKAPSAPVSVEAAYPTNYGLGGARWLLRSFFFGGGFGAANVHTRLNKVVANGTDTTAAYLSSLSTGPDLGFQTVLLLAFGGGLSRHVAGPMSLDLGYRYTRINTFAPAVNSNIGYVGVSFGQHQRSSVLLAKPRHVSGRRGTRRARRRRRGGRDHCGRGIPRRRASGAVIEPAAALRRIGFDAGFDVRLPHTQWKVPAPWTQNAARSTGVTSEMSDNQPSMAPVSVRAVPPSIAPWNPTSGRFSTSWPASGHRSLARRSKTRDDLNSVLTRCEASSGHHWGAMWAVSVERLP